MTDLILKEQSLDAYNLSRWRAGGGRKMYENGSPGTFTDYAGLKVSLVVEIMAEE